MRTVASQIDPQTQTVAIQVNPQNQTAATQITPAPIPQFQTVATQITPPPIPIDIERHPKPVFFYNRRRNIGIQTSLPTPNIISPPTIRPIQSVPPVSVTQEMDTSVSQSDVKPPDRFEEGYLPPGDSGGGITPTQPPILNGSGTIPKRFHHPSTASHIVKPQPRRLAAKFVQPAKRFAGGSVESLVQPTQRFTAAQKRENRHQTLRDEALREEQEDLEAAARIQPTFSNRFGGGGEKDFPERFEKGYLPSSSQAEVKFSPMLSQPSILDRFEDDDAQMSPPPTNRQKRFMRGFLPPPIQQISQPQPSNLDRFGDDAQMSPPPTNRQKRFMRGFLPPPARQTKSSTPETLPSGESVSFPPIANAVGRMRSRSPLLPIRSRINQGRRRTQLGGEDTLIFKAPTPPKQLKTYSRKSTPIQSSNVNRLFPSLSPIQKKVLKRPPGEEGQDIVEARRNRIDEPFRSTAKVPKRERKKNPLVSPTKMERKKPQKKKLWPLLLPPNDVFESDWSTSPSDTSITDPSWQPSQQKKRKAKKQNETRRKQR